MTIDRQMPLAVFCTSLKQQPQLHDYWSTSAFSSSYYQLAITSHITDFQHSDYAASRKMHNVITGGIFKNNFVTIFW